MGVAEQTGRAPVHEAVDVTDASPRCHACSVKIDRAFVTGLATCGDQSLVRRIVAIAALLSHDAGVRRPAFRAERAGNPDARDPVTEMIT